MDATLMKLTDEERAWVQAQLALVDRFVGDYAGDEVVDGLEGVDHAWASWLEQDTHAEGDDPDTILNAVAVALGQAVVDALDGFGWVTVFQDGQTDLAVTGLPDVDALFFPAEIVALEYLARNPKFLAQTRDHYVATINDLRT
ncbi:MAG TPA: DUF3806 domain-containing protein [Micromonosporaceae bacterium]